MTQNEKIKTRTCSSSTPPPAPTSRPHNNPVIPHNVLHCAVFLLVKEAFPIRSQLQDPRDSVSESKLCVLKGKVIWARIRDALGLVWPSPGAVTQKNYSIHLKGKYSSANAWWKGQDYNSELFHFHSRLRLLRTLRGENSCVCVRRERQEKLESGSKRRGCCWTSYWILNIDWNILLFLKLTVNL